MHSLFFIFYSLGKDHILQINVDRKFAPDVDDSGADSLKEADVSSVFLSFFSFFLSVKISIISSKNMFCDIAIQFNYYLYLNLSSQFTNFMRGTIDVIA